MTSMIAAGLAAAAALPVVPAFAQTRPLTCGELTAQQTEGPFSKTNTPRRSSWWAAIQGPEADRDGQVLSARCHRSRTRCSISGRGRGRRVRQPRLSLSRPPVHRRSRELSPANHRSGGIPRAHAAYPRQGAGSGNARADHPALLRDEPGNRATASTAQTSDAHARKGAGKGMSTSSRGLEPEAQVHFPATIGQLPSFSAGTPAPPDARPILK